MKRSGSMGLCGLFVLLVVSVLVIASPTLATAETATVLWEGNVTLTNETTFTYVPSNNASASYTVNTTTDLGALTATGLALNASDTWYASYGSFYINSIGGIENEVWPNSTWCIYINDVAASKGLGGNELEDGDNVKFYFCPANATTYAYITENASYLVNITVNTIPDILFEGTVTLKNETTFTYVPYDNASGSYTVNITTDLGALTATGLAFNASDRYHASMGTFWIDSIAGIENEVWPSSTWCIYINDVAASMGLGGNELEDGDNVKFYFCPANATTYAYITENASYLVNITVNTIPDILFEDTVTLANETTFTYVPSNNASASYTVNTTTDLGALTATGLALNASDTWYASYGSFYINSIGGIENEVWPNSTWCIYINDVAASKGLGGNELEDGDNVKFYFCPANATTYAYITENASYLVNITVNTIPDILFEGTVTLKNETTFTYVPYDNASGSYTVNITTDLGALTATGLAFNASDRYHTSMGTFWIDSIAGIENEVWPSSTWCIYINDVAASMGLGGNELEDGDNVKFYFCPANATTYAYITENASYLVNITVNVTALPTSTPTTPRISGGGGRAAPPAKTGETQVSTDPTSKVTTTTLATSADAKAIVTIPVGTIAKDVVGKAIEKVSVKPASKIPSIPPKVSLPGLPGTTGAKYAYDFGPAGATFSEPVDISITFDPADFPDGVTPVIYTYEAGEWKSLDTTVVANRAIAKVYHFSTFVLFAEEKVVEVISTPTPTPTLLPVATLTPTPAPIPTTKPRIYGFEAVLAIAGLLAVAYLVLSKKRK